jgi:hypothetical protein
MEGVDRLWGKRCWWWWGAAFSCARGGGLGLKTRKPKPSRRGSIMGAPLGAAVGNDGRRWLGGGHGVVVAVGLFVRLRKRGRRVLGRKPKTELPGLGYGCAVGSSCGE